MLKEDALPDLKTEYEVDSEDRSGQYSCIFLPEHAGRTDLEVKGPQHQGREEVGARHGGGDCDPGLQIGLLPASHQLAVVQGKRIWGPGHHQQHPEQVLRGLLREPHRAAHPQRGPEGGPRQVRVQRHQLEGTSQAAITLRVRNRFAALWPFLGIVAEVLVLVTIIFIYEKRRKPDEVLDDEDIGSAPLKSSGNPLNDKDKDKNVRQRNSS